ncbi:ATP-binding cassette domain-containing protein [Leuconostoc sp. MS02]|uniref:ATP-binding cassette domain-containing protein n=1 Tax=Leuconostoc aquikimchii TaxID=3236804 RepID=A0ABV3S0I7_9LACO
MLLIKKIKKTFNRTNVLSNLTLEVKDGELVHIEGSNGSGKSTLFKLITGLLQPDTGTITMDTADVVGALIENPGFLEFESALTNLRFLGNSNHRFDEKRTTELMKQFELDPKNSQAVSKYSIGMRQKLGIIQAVMENQNVILLDEPTRGLDTASIDQFIELLQKLKTENKIVIVASHDHIDGIHYDKTLSLKNGKLVE